MMTRTFLGVPLLLWGIGCLVLTGVWVVLWPSDRVVAQEGLRFIILRWFHALTWLLLGVAAFVAGFNILGGARLAQPIALMSLVVYLIFMATFITSSKVS